MYSMLCEKRSNIVITCTSLLISFINKCNNYYDFNEYNIDKNAIFKQILDINIFRIK